MAEFMAKSAAEIAQRLAVRGSDSASWAAVLFSDNGGDAISGLLDDLSNMLQKKARVVSLADRDFAQLRALLHKPDDDIAVLTALGDLPSEKWSSLDLMRSALERRGPLVLCLTSNGFASLSQSAPNIRSFIGPSIFIAKPDGGLMTENERLERLAQLTQHYGLTNEHVVEQAQAGTLQPDPEFVEWLVLLGRGDLV